MAGKKVSFGTKPQKQPDVDAWVESREATTDKQKKGPTSTKQVESEPKAKAGKSEKKVEDQGSMKRLTLDIPEALHRRIKGKAVMEGVTMVNMLRELLEENYG